jgi:hypothetical protein
MRHEFSLKKEIGYCGQTSQIVNVYEGRRALEKMTVFRSGPFGADHICWLGLGTKFSFPFLLIPFGFIYLRGFIFCFIAGMVACAHSFGPLTENAHEVFSFCIQFNLHGDKNGTG